MLYSGERFAVRKFLKLEGSSVHNIHIYICISVFSNNNIVVACIYDKTLFTELFCSSKHSYMHPSHRRRLCVPIYECKIILYYNDFVCEWT